MSNHGTPLTTTGLKKFSGTVALNLPEIDDELAKDFGKNGDVVASLLEEAFTRANLERRLIALGKKRKPEPILRYVATTTLPTRTAKFAPKEKYVVNVRSGSHVKIRYIDAEYLQLCGDSFEEPSAEVVLCSHELVRQSAFAPAIGELNENGVITKVTPGEQFSLMERQPDGPNSAPGLLLTNGYANLLEVVFPNGVTRLVDLNWCGDGWYVYVNPVSDSDQWNAERQILSRDSRGAMATVPSA